MNKKYFFQHIRKYNNILQKLINISKDFVAGALLKILIDLDKDNEEKWIIEKRKNYVENYAITARQLDRALKILLNESFVEKKIAKVDEKPILHIAINYDKLLETLVFNIEDRNENQANDYKENSVKNHESTDLDRNNAQLSEIDQESQADSPDNLNANELFSSQNWVIR